MVVSNREGRVQGVLSSNLGVVIRKVKDFIKKGKFYLSKSEWFWSPIVIEFINA